MPPTVCRSRPNLSTEYGLRELAKVGRRRRSRLREPPDYSVLLHSDLVPELAWRHGEIPRQNRRIAILEGANRSDWRHRRDGDPGGRRFPTATVPVEKGNS
jgi:hypothetical protein